MFSALAWGCGGSEKERAPIEDNPSGDGDDAPNDDPPSSECKKNSCGVCEELEHEVGEPCGPCGADVYVCSSRFHGTTECSGNSITVDCNAGCGGDVGGGGPGGTLGEKCGACNLGEWACLPDGKRMCTGIALGMNACGGCEPLDYQPGERCGPCGLDHYVCDGRTVTCSGHTTENLCGGCGALTHDLGSPCDGPDQDSCSDDAYECDGQGQATCSHGEDACASCRIESVTLDGYTNADPASRCDTIGTLRVTGDGSLYEEMTLLRHVDTLIVDAATLESLGLFDKVESIGTLTISDTSLLDNLGGLSSLRSLDRLEIRGARRLTSLDGLAEINIPKGVYLENLPRLTSIAALSGVTQPENISLVALPALASLHGLENVVEVDDTVLLQEVPALASLDGLHSLKKTQRLTLLGRPLKSDPPSGLFTDLSGLASLEEVTQHITIMHQASLNSLAGLPPRLSVLELWDAPKLVHAEYDPGPPLEINPGTFFGPMLSIKFCQALESVAFTHNNPDSKSVSLDLQADRVLKTVTAPDSLKVYTSAQDCPLLESTPP